MPKAEKASTGPRRGGIGRRAGARTVAKGNKPTDARSRDVHSEDEMNMDLDGDNSQQQDTLLSGPGVENVAPVAETKKRRARKPLSARVTTKKPKTVKTAARRISGGSTTGAGVSKSVKSTATTTDAKKRGRRALAEIQNDSGKLVEEPDDSQNAGQEIETGDVDDLVDVPAATSTASKRSRRVSNTVKEDVAPTKGTGRGRRKKQNTNNPEDETVQSITEPIETATAPEASSTAPKKRAGRPPRSDIASGKSEEDKAQADTSAMEIETEQGYEPGLAQSSSQKANDPPTRKIRRVSSPKSRRISGGSLLLGNDRGPASDGATSAQLRRKLGNVNSRFEVLEGQYRELEEVGVKEAERNFDKLKRAADERTKAANDLIASLRAELATQKSIAAETDRLNRQIKHMESEAADLTSNNKALQNNLTTSQNEIKALQAKVAATRSNSASVSDSAMKNRTNKVILPGSAEAAKEAQKRLLKEELYSDLTGLLVLDVKRSEQTGEDLYDCIQTGRNGTLHFYLSIAPTSAQPSTYEDEEFTYTPHLDTARDKDLLQILPDYLTEEICFPRSNAAKFYSRVKDCLFKKIELVDENDAEEPNGG